MQYEEHYFVTTKSADGAIESEKFDDVEEALKEYRTNVRFIAAGETVDLIRYSAVTLCHAVRAK